MFITYTYCRATREGDPAEYVIAFDDIKELNELDYANLGPTDCIWFVPNTEGPLG
jgi:hypothetical protein